MWLAPEGVQIRVDRVREAILFSAGRPYEAARRVVVVPQAELLGLEAANALLKSLEEPGRHLRWILATTRPEALPSTVLSRCVVARIPAAPREERLAAAREQGLSSEAAEDFAACGVPEPPRRRGARASSGAPR
jgi:DNA polymerase-3 subunit delta'